MKYNRPIRRYRDSRGNLWINGQPYMGPVQIPPLPDRIALTDRVTGTVSVLSHTGSPGSLTIALVSVDPSWSDVAKYAPREEPWVQDPAGNAYRLSLSSGVISVAPSGIQGSSARVLTRNGSDTHVLEVSAAADGTVLYTEVDL